MKFLKILAGILLLAGCQSKEEAPNKVSTHGYFYFPKPNIYYDTTEKNFVYFDTASRQWRSGNLPTTFIRSDLGRSILIDSPPQPVWTANKQHQLVYSAKLYADSSDFKKPSPPPSKPIASAPDSTDSSADMDTQGKRKKTRVGELLDKIFGKRKNEN